MRPHPQLTTPTTDAIHSSEPRSSKAAVAGPHGARRLVATRAVAAGERIFLLDGPILPSPDRYTVQIDENAHVAPILAPDEDDDAHSLWRFMNHACDPSACIRDREVFALRALRPGDEITFDYHTTEFDLAAPFACHCGDPSCHGLIRGFKHLTRAERERLRPRLAPHLARLLDLSADPAASAPPA